VHVNPVSHYSRAATDNYKCNVTVLNTETVHALRPVNKTEPTNWCFPT